MQYNILQQLIQQYYIVTQMQGFLQTKRQKYFAVLLVFQLAIIILQVVAGQFYSSLNTTLFRIVFLLVANFCLSDNWAYLYSVFCIISALYLIDPIGLFITGHGQNKKLAHNLLLIIAFVLLLIASYIGYLFAKQISLESGGSGSTGFNFAPVNQPAARTNQPSYSYGGSNYLYQNPTSRQSNERRQQQNQAFQAFQGQSYSLN